MSFNGEKPLTVGEVKAIIKDLPETTQIIVGHSGTTEWANLKFVSVPNEEQGYLGLTFELVDDYDPRQF